MQICVHAGWRCEMLRACDFFVSWHISSWAHFSHADRVTETRLIQPWHGAISSLLLLDWLHPSFNSASNNTSLCTVAQFRLSLFTPGIICARLPNNIHTLLPVNQIFLLFFLIQQNTLQEKNIWRQFCFKVDRFYCVNPLLACFSYYSSCLCVQVYDKSRYSHLQR